ncbi:MAG: 8-amino-7-oxononanoate synthase [Fuerstiella sp.]
MDHDRLQSDIEQRLQQLRTKDQYRSTKVVTGNADGTCTFQDRTVVNFSGNDYLNLAHDIAASQQYQQTASSIVGSTASALVSGRSIWHERLEQQLATFENTEAALLFPTGYAANLGIMTGLVQSADLVLCDRDNHASIIDACRQCDGRMLVFRRDRLENLEATLKKRRSEYRHAFIVCDGVYSMDGTVPDLKHVVDIANRYEAAVIVDEAHGTGILGCDGRGASQFCEVEDQIFARVGTMSKAMGGLGGFVVSNQSTINLLRNTARTQFFSTALPPAICAAMLESIRIIQSEPKRRTALQSLVHRAHSTCQDLGLKTIGSGPAPIVPIIIGNSESAQQVSRQLLQHGFLVPAIRPPTVKAGTERLRLSLNIHHTEDQISEVCKTIQQFVSRSDRP